MQFFELIFNSIVNTNLIIYTILIKQAKYLQEEKYSLDKHQHEAP